jgi:hypothetical protein
VDTETHAERPGGPEVHVRPLDLDIEPISLVANLPATLVITPYLSCREIAGAHFGFARSFVQRDALPQLSQIAEMLLAEDANGDLSGRRAMIFGHSDLSGPDDLNKALAERRARAIHALFTHDAEAWEKLFSGSDDGPYWQERWDVWEAQHMLNALGVTGDSGLPLVENGARDKRLPVFGRATTRLARPNRRHYPLRSSSASTAGVSSSSPTQSAYHASRYQKNLSCQSGLRAPRTWGAASSTRSASARATPRAGARSSS